MKKLSKYKVYVGSKETIEPEEIFFDPQNIAIDSMGQMEVPIKRRNVMIFFGLVIFALIIIGGRVLGLQIFQYEELFQIAEANRTRRVKIEAPRGIIFDRSGRQLVFNEPTIDAVVVPAFLPANSIDRNRILEKLSLILGKSGEEVALQIKKYDDYFPMEVVIKENLDRESILAIDGQINALEGVYLIQRNSRKYVDGQYFSHILGYVGQISPEELIQNQDHSMNDTIGKYGMELYYENELRGIYGERKFEAGILNKKDAPISIKNPVPGNDLLLTIDYDLQKKLYEALSRKIKMLNVKKGAGIIINPKNGEILALVSFPAFDNNVFSQISKKQSPGDIFNDPADPLFNRAISGVYPPGSTIKPLLAAAILEEGLISPHTKIFAAGSISIANQYNPDILYTFHDWKEHGWIDITDAIAHSSNVYFYTLGGGYKNIEGLGITKIKEYLERFNVGKVLGIDLPGEAKGIAPDPRWKKEIKNEDWYQGDTYNVSIGQGDIAMTPLQLASATSYLSTYGIWYRPHIVKEVIYGSETKSVEAIELKTGFIARSNIDVVREGMREAITSGSAQLLNGIPQPVAGKTGTAQFGVRGKTHAWFTGFAPFDDPRLVITIIIEEGGEGSQSAVPVAKEVLEWYFRNYK